MRDVVITALEALGLLLVAAGAVAALLPLIGWAALACGGIVVLGGARFADGAKLPRLPRLRAGHRAEARP